MGLDLIQKCQRTLALDFHEWLPSVQRFVGLRRGGISVSFGNKQVQEDVEDGILYMDAGAGEAFHFNGGLPSLLELGARAISSLEHASPFDAAISWRGTVLGPVEKIVILTSRLLTESHQDVIRCLGMHPSIRHCTIWTSISEEAHSAHPDTAFGLDAFHDYKNSLFRDLGKSFSQASARAASKKRQKSSVDEGREDDRFVSSQQTVPQREVPAIEVKHFPMMVCSFTKSVFVLPSRGSVAEAPLSDHRDVHAVSRGLPGIEVSSQAGGEERIPAGATLTAHCLQHMAAQMDLKFEVFTLGPLAHTVGKVMAGLSSPPEGAGHHRRPAGLILIDRSQDLITPSSHGDSLLDRVFSSLPRRVLPAESNATGTSHPMLSSIIARPPMDIRIPVHPVEEKMGRSEISGPCFPLFPIMAIGGLVDKSSGSQQSSGPAEVVGVGSSAPVCSAPEIPEGRTDLMGGSLSTSWDRRGSEYLEALLGKRTKDSVMLIRKWLQEALRQEKVNVPGKGRLGAVSINELRSLRRALTEKSDMALRHMALIQVARAAELALGVHWGSHWDAFAGAERILMLSAGDSTQSLILQLQDIVQQYIQSMRRLSLAGGASSTTDLLTLRDALTLAIVGYGLAGEDMQVDNHGGPFTWEEEQALKEAVVEAILQGSPGASLGFLQNLEGALSAFLQRTDSKEIPTPDFSQKSLSTDDEWDRWEGVDPVEDEGAGKTEEYGEVQLKLELRDRLGEVFGVLHKVASACSQTPLQELPLPVESQSSAGGLHTGLIYKILSLIFAKADIPGLQHHASGMGRFLKGGLGRFGLRQTKAKPSEQKVLLVFVIGGLNFVEVREAREAQAAVPGGEGIELLLGGTTLITPSDMYDLLLGSCGSV